MKKFKDDMGNVADDEFYEEGDDIGNRDDYSNERNHHENGDDNRRRRRRLAPTGNIVEISKQKRDGILVDQRVAILVDVQNMYHSAKKIFDGRLSYQKLLDQVIDERHLIRAIAYVSEREGIDQSKFYDSLSFLGFDVVKKMLKFREDGTLKNPRGSWQVEYTINAIDLASKVDSIILVTGDGDFVPLVNKIRALGTKLEVACFKDSASEALLQSADSVHYMDESFMHDGR